MFSKSLITDCSLLSSNNENMSPVSSPVSPSRIVQQIEQRVSGLEIEVIPLLGEITTHLESAALTEAELL